MPDKAAYCGCRGRRPVRIACTSAASTPSSMANVEWAATVHGHWMVTALVSNRICFSHSLKLPPWKLEKLAAKPFSSTGFSAMVAMTLGRKPNFCASACKVARDFPAPIRSYER